MTSWIRVDRRKPEDKERSYYFQTDDLDIAQQFTSYAYSVMLAQSNGRPLSVYDRSNPIALNYEMIHKTFRDISGVSFVDTALPASISLGSKNSGRILPYITGIPVSALKSKARSILQWSPAVQQEVALLKTLGQFPAKLDVCVHLRNQPSNSTLGSRVVTVQNYIQALEQRFKGSTTLSVFVIAESPLLLDEFRRRVNSAWNLFSISPQTETSRPTAKVRIQLFQNYLAELAIAQTCPLIVSTLTSPTGRFLYLTSNETTNFVSLDTNTFVPL
jgi:hypothetical protein